MDGVGDWRAAIGREKIERQTPDAQSRNRFALAVGCKRDDPPPLSHWSFFLPDCSDEEIGVDGHPRRGGFLPPVTLPRRMFAGASMTFERPIELGVEATLTSVIADVTHKSGRTGDLVFVEVDRTITQRGVSCVRERQRYVYRGEGAGVAMPTPNDAIPDGEHWSPNEVNLFRFSAATFNSHRIHYDRDYATKVEGYPALVIHGPFTAVKLAILAARAGELARFSFRAEAPLFLGQPVVLQRADEGVYRAVRVDGTTAMTAEVAFA